MLTDQFQRVVGVGLALVALALAWLVLRRERHLTNPVGLMTLFFFLPLSASLMRLSGYQVRLWTFDTWSVIAESILLWLILPALFLLMPTGAHRRVERDNAQTPATYTRSIVWYARIGALMVIAGTGFQNYLLGGHVLLALYPEQAFALHALRVPVIQILARSAPAFAGLEFLLYRASRKRFDLLLLVVLVVLPLTRLARMDLLLSILTLVVIGSQSGAFRLTRTRGVVLAFAGIAFVLAMVAVGQVRTSRFGRYSISYASGIRYNGYPGPGESIAVLYGYFALPFENFDRFVRQNEFHHTHGLLSFSPLFNTFFVVDRLVGRDYPRPELVEERSDEINRAALVGTALSTFYLDFGTGAALPIGFYMGLWLLLHRRRARSVGWLLAYSLYSSAMALSCFQAVVTAPFVYQGIVLATIPFAPVWASMRRTGRPFGHPMPPT